MSTRKPAQTSLTIHSEGKDAVNKKTERLANTVRSFFACTSSFSLLKVSVVRSVQIQEQMIV